MCERKQVNIIHWDLQISFDRVLGKKILKEVLITTQCEVRFKMDHKPVRKKE